MDHYDAVKRLKVAEGHIRAIQGMLEKGVYCIDVIHQIQAVKAALNKVSFKILEDHLNSCVITAVKEEDPEARERVMKEIIEVFEKSTKFS